jgi:putative ABC transport system substrate-binding protein
MERRTFLVTIASGLLAAPLAAAAQPAGKMYRLGFLNPAAPPTSSDRTVFALLLATALRELGYAEGQNLLIEARYAEGKRDRLSALARELVQLRMDVILAVGNEATHAAQDATKTIPIVMMGVNPVEERFVASLAKPGGNITGVVISDTGLATKRLQLLKEAVPRATRVAVLSPGAGDYTIQLRETEKAAASLGVTLVVVEVRNSDYERAYASMVAGRAGALFVMSSPLLNRDRTPIIALAGKHRLPSISNWREYAEQGGLMAYGSNLSGLSRRLATYVDRILKGASPAGLPVEQPTAYELVINLKTAKALGLTIPPSLLLRADEVIQ